MALNDVGTDVLHVGIDIDLTLNDVGTDMLNVGRNVIPHSCLAGWLPGWPSQCQYRRQSIVFRCRYRFDPLPPAGTVGSQPAPSRVLTKTL